MSNNTTEQFGLCGCGRPVRYISPIDHIGACNKYGRCKTWDELHERNKVLESQLREAKKWCRQLLPLSAFICSTGLNASDEVGYVNVPESDVEFLKLIKTANCVSDDSSLPQHNDVLWQCKTLSSQAHLANKINKIVKELE